MKNFTQSNWIQNLVETEFQLLPEVKYFTLKYLCFHLAKIAANYHINEMSPSNLARIFGPTLYGTLEINPQHNQPQLQIAIIELMIAQCQLLFKERNSSELQVK
jgi:hypothetical protein